MCGNESPYNAVAQNLVESALRQRKVNTGAFGHDRLLVNTRPREYYSLLHRRLDYSRKRLISKLKNDMQVRKPEK